MTFIIRYTDQAEADILRNANWWAERHSLQQALSFESTVEQQLSTLSSMPERFGVAPENDKFPIEIRQMMVGLGSRPSYRAIYTIQNNVVLILAVRRGEQTSSLHRRLPRCLGKLSRSQFDSSTWLLPVALLNCSDNRVQGILTDLSSFLCPLFCPAYPRPILVLSA